jgi:UDP-N-acetylmuramate--alanine ligase
MDIYPARELPMEGITSEWLLSKVKKENKKLVQKSELMDEILNSNATIIVTIGAGDIGELVPKIKSSLI